MPFSSVLDFPAFSCLSCWSILVEDAIKLNIRVGIIALLYCFKSRFSRSVFVSSVLWFRKNVLYCHFPYFVIFNPYFCTAVGSYFPYSFYSVIVQHICCHPVHHIEEYSLFRQMISFIQVFYSSIPLKIIISDMMLCQNSIAWKSTKYIAKKPY